MFVENTLKNTCIQTHAINTEINIFFHATNRKNICLNSFHVCVPEMLKKNIKIIHTFASNAFYVPLIYLNAIIISMQNIF